MKYRPEIDGLRAVAVVPVILFHAGAPGFSGGYVGVDVFFVISGYLITGLILEELRAGRFSLVTFYERRARRILPALLLVVTACLPFAWAWFTPAQLSEFARSVAAVTVFSSNILFWRETGYFDAAAELKPLLHTWSLAVEEQFYLVFPMLLVLAWKQGRRWVPAWLGVLGVASFGFTQAGALDPGGAFFLLPGRGWELMLGAAIAAGGEGTHTSWVRQAGAAMGLALIAFSVVVIDDTVSLPGYHALLPTVGAALVILYARDNSPAVRLLASRPLVRVGLVSYSAYLWHFPLFAFARHRSVGEPGPEVFAGLCFVTMVLAWLSWRFVELPFRNRARVSRQDVLVFGSVGCVALLALAIAGMRIGDQRIRSAAIAAPDDPEAVPHWIGLNGAPCVSEGANLCQLTSASGRGSTLLLGDSHSADFLHEFRRYALERGIDAWGMSVGGCAFMDHHLARHGGNCREARERVEREVRARHFGRVVFVANLAGHFAQLEGDPLRANLESLDTLFAEVRASGAELIVFAPRPYFNASPARARELGRPGELRLVTDPRHATVDAWLRQGSVRIPFTLFDQYSAVLAAGCGRSACFDGYTTDGVQLYRDHTHLTPVGARLVFSLLVPVLDQH